jgi:hypothetical protein
LPADSSFPGQTPAQELRWCSRGYTDIFTPIATITFSIAVRFIPPNPVQTLQPRVVAKRVRLLADPAADLFDVAFQLIQVHRGVLHQEPMMLGEMTLQRQLQLGDLAAQPPFRQAG